MPYSKTGGCQHHPSDPQCGCGSVTSEPMSGETQNVGLTEQERSWGTMLGGHLWFTEEQMGTFVAARVAAERERANTAAADAWEQGRQHAELNFISCPDDNPYRAALDTPREEAPDEQDNAAETFSDWCHCEGDDLGHFHRDTPREDQP